MIGEEYRDLAALWAAPEPVQERDELARLARRTPWLARAAQYGDLAVVALLSSAIGAAIVWRLGPVTLLIGSLVLLILSVSAWKRHRLANVAMLVDTSDRFSFICSLVRAKEAELERSALSLALVPPALVTAMLLGYALQAAPGDPDALAYLSALLVTPRSLVSLAFLGCALLLLVMSHLRLIRELRRLRELRDDYLVDLRGDTSA